MLRRSLKRAGQFFLAHRGHLEKKIDGVILDVIHHLVEKFEGLALVFHEGVPLAVGPEMNAFTKIVK